MIECLIFFELSDRFIQVSLKCHVIISNDRWFSCFLNNQVLQEWRISNAQSNSDESWDDKKKMTNLDPWQFCMNHSLKLKAVQVQTELALKFVQAYLWPSSILISFFSPHFPCALLFLILILHFLSPASFHIVDH